MRKFSALYIVSVFFIAALHAPIAQAAWANSGAGTVTYVRSYPMGSTGLRLELGVTGAGHSCGTDSSVYYFDSTSIGMDATKALLALAFGAMSTGKTVVITYDCAIASGGFGWGIGIKVSN